MKKKNISINCKQTVAVLAACGCNSVEEVQIRNKPWEGEKNFQTIGFCSIS